MALFFLLWSVFCALLTVNVFQPVHWSDNRLFVLSIFAASWLIGDLALHWIVFNLGVTFFFFIAGALESKLGQFALLLLLLSWIPLGWRFRLLIRLKLLVDQQMKAALGADYEQLQVEDYPKTVSATSINWRIYWNPFLLLKDARIEIISNIPFYHDQGISLTLDIYRPRHHASDCPVLLQIHGGAWTIGKNNQGIPLMVRMAARGWICFSISYRLSPQAVFPDHLIDCKRAIHWIKTNGKSYGADPNFLVVTGGSAGAHLAALTALTPGDVEFQPEFADVDTTVQGCVAFYGIYDLETHFEKKSNLPLQNVLKTAMRSTPHRNPAKFRQASPIRRISKNPPPFMLIQGEIDSLIAPDETLRFHDALRKADTPSLVLLKLPWVGHGFDALPTVSAQMVLPVVEQFLSFLRTKFLCATRHELSRTGTIN